MLRTAAKQSFAPKPVTKQMKLSRFGGHGEGVWSNLITSMNEPKPKRNKRQFDEAFRRNAAALVESSGRSLREIAGELGVSQWNLRDWTKAHGRNKPVSSAMSPAEMQREMARLRRENESLAARCDVLKKALGILAEPTGNASHA
jgi:transposase